MANTTGGAMHITQYEAKHNLRFRSRQINIINCTFIGNKGNGAATEIIMKQPVAGYIPHVVTHFSVHFESCRFHSNRVPSEKHSSVIELTGTKAIFLSNCNFIDNYGTVFHLESSNLHFFGSIHFENNYAAYGGALKLCDSSFVYLHNQTNVLFINNTAHKGGAIYHDQQKCLDTIPMCFFQLVLYQTIPIEKCSDLIKVKFVNNSALLAGDAIYGGSIDYCHTLVTFSYDENSEFFNSKYIFQTIFDMTEQSGPSSISSDPYGVCFCDLLNGDKMCWQFIADIVTFPGQKFTVSVVTIGQFNGTTVGLIDAKIADSDPTYNELMSVNNFNINVGCVNLTYKVFSNQTEIKINFTTVTSNMNAYFEPIYASLFVCLLSCPFGFTLTKTPPYRCLCDPLLYEYGTSCNIDTQVIHIPAITSLWFGCDSYETDNKSECHLSVTPECLHYCNASDRYVHMLSWVGFDDLCLPGRTGVLCGACKPGLSRVLGSLTKCQRCSNENLLFLIPLFLLSGMLIIILLTALNLTVTEGTINGLVIYANVMYMNQDLFSNGSHTFSKILWIFIAWLNLDIGLEICFYKGMDGYQQIWLQYGFVFYLLALQLIIVLLCRKFVLFTRLFRRSVLKVLATLLFVMYSPLTYTLAYTFCSTYIHVSTPNGTEKRTVWYFDANVSYLGAKHISLFIVGLICCTTMCSFTFFLLLNQCLQRKSNFFCLRWIERLRPFFETYTGPCHDNYRFWPGFLMFVRFCLTIFNVTRTRKFSILVTTTLYVVIMSLSCIFPRGVYKKWPLNVLEFCFIVNLCITSVLLTIYGKEYTDRTVYTSVSIAMLMFLVILTYHVSVRIKSIISGHIKLNSQFSKLTQKIPCMHQIGLCCCQKESGESDEITPLL